MKYDYLIKQKHKTVLTHDGKNSDVIIIKGFNDYVLNELGKLNFLKGYALKDYLKKRG